MALLAATCAVVQKVIDFAIFAPCSEANVSGAWSGDYSGRSYLCQRPGFFPLGGYRLSLKHEGGFLCRLKISPTWLLLSVFVMPANRQILLDNAEYSRITYEIIATGGKPALTQLLEAHYKQLGQLMRSVNPLTCHTIRVQEKLAEWLNITYQVTGTATLLGAMKLKSKQ